MRHFTILLLVSATACVDEPPAPPPIDTDTSRCDPTAPFGPAIPLDALDTDAQESGARLTPDELAIYFASTRPGGAGGYDLYRATRATIYEPFGSAEWLAALATPGDERDPWPAYRGSFVLFERDGDIMNTTFDGTAYTPPEPVVALNTPGIERSPMLTDDGVYLSVDGTIVLAPTFYGALLPPMTVDELVSHDDDVGVVVARPAETMLLARRPTSGASTQIWSTQHSPELGVYEAPQLLMQGANARVSLAPDWISEDGCVMYLESNETGNFDLYVARRYL